MPEYSNTTLEKLSKLHLKPEEAVLFLFYYTEKKNEKNSLYKLQNVVGSVKHFRHLNKVVNGEAKEKLSDMPDATFRDKSKRMYQLALESMSRKNRDKVVIIDAISALEKKFGFTRTHEGTVKNPMVETTKSTINEQAKTTSKGTIMKEKELPPNDENSSGLFNFDEEVKSTNQGKIMREKELSSSDENSKGASNAFPDKASSNNCSDRLSRKISALGHSPVDAQIFLYYYQMWVAKKHPVHVKYPYGLHHAHLLTKVTSGTVERALRDMTPEAFRDKAQRMDNLARECVEEVLGSYDGNLPVNGHHLGGSTFSVGTI